MSVPVVFLDVDGVLHSLHGRDLFVRRCMSILADIVKSTGASIVLSSTWRTKEEQVILLNQKLREYGMKNVKDRTPDFAHGGTRFHQAREEEICYWLDQHPEVDRWVVLDDLDLTGADTVAASRLRGHFVRTGSEIGLQLEHGVRAVEILMEGTEYSAKARKLPAPAPRSRTSSGESSGKLEEKSGKREAPRISHVSPPLRSLNPALHSAGVGRRPILQRPRAVSVGR